MRGRWFGAVLALLITVLTNGAALTTAASAARFTYDEPAATTSNTHVHAERSQVQLIDKRVASASAARGASTAPSARGVATNTGVQTIADEGGQVQSFDSFGQAKSSLGTNPGEDIHHVVEQCQCNASRSGFTPQQVNSTDNLVRLPRGVHDEISAYYSSRPPGFSTTVRNALNGMSWQEQWNFGIDVVQRASNGLKLR